MQQTIAVLVFTLLTGYSLSGSLETKRHSDNQGHQSVFRRIVHLANRKRSFNPARGLPAAIDLTIALDTSAASQGVHQFELQKKMASLVASEFSISPSGTRVSLVSFFHRPRRFFDFITFLNKECTIRAINSIRPPSTLYSSADLENVFAATTRGWRNDALKIVLLFLNDYQVVSWRVQDLMARYLGNVEVFVLAVGSGDVLNSPWIRFASKPRSSHFISAKSYYTMMKKLSAIKNKGVHKQCDPERQFTYDECGRWCVCKDGGTRRQCYRIRKAFTTMSFEERVRFVQTIKQANLDPMYREEFSRLTNIHMEQFFHGIHNVTFFLPWHRWYLYEFENLLRRIDCRVTIPYWDWARAPENAWRESHARDIWNPGPHGLGGNGSPEEDDCVMDGPFRKGVWYKSKKSGSGCIKRCFQYDKKPRGSSAIRMSVASRFTVFEYNVRKVFHNELHCLIAGTMGGINSSQSPEFWLHHAFLDKIWVQYQKRGIQQRNEYYPQIRDSLPGCRSKWRPGDFVHETSLPGCVGIVYEQAEDREDQRRTETREETLTYKDVVCLEDRKNRVDLTDD